jgi:hypothetical protein
MDDAASLHPLCNSREIARLISKLLPTRRGPRVSDAGEPGSRQNVQSMTASSAKHARPPKWQIECALVLVATLALGIVATVASAGAAPAHHPNCDPQGARVLAQNREVRIYRRKAKHPADGIYACLRRTGRTVTIARPGQRALREFAVEHITLAGAMVAYTSSTHGVDTGSTSIEVLDVADGHVVLTVPQAAGFVDACVIQFRRITDLLVTARGSIAWISEKGTRCKTTTLQLYSAQVSTAPVLLDEGPTIASESLRLHDGAVSWEDSGRVASAQLP